MRRVVVKWVLSFLFLVLFTACGGGGGGIDATVVSQPKVSSNDSGNIVVSGTINLKSGLSGTDAINGISLNGLEFNLPSESNCSVLSTNLPSSADITSNLDLSFEAVLSGECYDIDTMTLDATESILYSNGANEAKAYSYTMTFDNSKILNAYNSLAVNINSPTVINLDNNTSLTYQVMNDTSDKQISNEDTKSVKIETSDSSKIVFADSNGNQVDFITYSNTPYGQVALKGISSGVASIVVSATTLIDGFTIKKSNSVSLNIGTATNESKYEIKLSVGDSLSVDKEQTIGIDIAESGSDTNFIENQNVTSVQVTATNNLLYFTDINEHTYSYSSSARKSINVHTGIVAGIEIIHVRSDIFDGEKQVVLEKDFPVTVIGGAPHTISIVYKASTFDAPFFYDTYIVHAVDKYGNPAKSGSRIYLGAVNGLDKDSNNHELYVTNGATISNSEDKALFTLTNNLFDFSNVEGRDSVVVLAEDDKMDPSYLGGWIVDSVEDSKNLLFNKQYEGANQTGLTFVVGNERRYDMCDQEPKLVDFDSSDNSYLLDEGGMKEIRLRYPSYMVGKDVYLYVNSYDENRTGVSIRKKLHGTGINASVNSTGCNVGENCDITVFFSVSGSSDALRDENLYLGNFAISSSCKNAKMTKSNTGCDGKIVINVDYDDGCSVEWQDLPYEH